MKIECPNCNYSKQVDGNMFPQGQDVKLSCPKCAEKFVVNNQAAEAPEEEGAFDMFDAPAEEAPAAPMPPPSMATPQAPAEAAAPPPMPEPTAVVTEPVAPRPKPQRSGGGEPHLLVVNLLDRLLDAVRGLLGRGFFEKNARLAEVVGHYGALAAALIGLVIGLVAAIRAEEALFLGMGLGWVCLVLIGQYVAHKFIQSGAKLIAATPSRASSKAFFDCLSLFNLLCAVAAVVGGLLLAVNTGNWLGLVSGLTVAWLFLYYASLSLNLPLLNVELVDEASAGQEAVGLISFFMKGMLKIVPIGFGAGIVLGSVNLLVALFYVIDGSYRAEQLAVVGSYAVLTALFTPLLAYLTFMFYHLLIDIVTAILILPGKLEARGDAQSDDLAA